MKQGCTRHCYVWATLTIAMYGLHSPSLCMGCTHHWYVWTALTIAMYGLRKVKAKRACDRKVTMQATPTHRMLRPVRSTMNPNTGDPTAEMMYTMLDTLFATVSLISYLYMKNTL